MSKECCQLMRYLRDPGTRFFRYKGHGFSESIVKLTNKFGQSSKRAIKVIFAKLCVISVEDSVHYLLANVFALIRVKRTLVRNVCKVHRKMCSF